MLFVPSKTYKIEIVMTYVVQRWEKVRKDKKGIDNASIQILNQILRKEKIIVD